jgi:Leucine-rich repeat (LRR) protein
VELGALTQIEDFDFDGNFLISGSIPDMFSGLQSLQSLDIDTSIISGPLPPSLFEATTITSLDMDTNRISGSIPSAIGNMADLTLLLINKNRLTGSLPEQLGNVNDWTFLALDSNQFEGPIPSSLSKHTNLKVFTVHNNVNEDRSKGISGSIPSFFGNFKDLELLSLFNTTLSGPIPTALGGMSNIRNLFLHNTDLTGTMPDEICRLRAADGNDMKLVQLTADCSGPNPKVECDQPTCCTACF